MPLLELRNVTRRFGELVAVDNLSFDIEACEFFSLLGKTTLLRRISGLDAPDAGDIFLDGGSLLRITLEERPIHTVFQSYARRFPT